MSLRLNKAFGIVEAVIEARSSVRDNTVLSFRNRTMYSVQYSEHHKIMTFLEFHVGKILF